MQFVFRLVSEIKMKFTLLLIPNNNMLHNVCITFDLLFAKVIAAGWWCLLQPTAGYVSIMLNMPMFRCGTSNIDCLLVEVLEAILLLKEATSFVVSSSITDRETLFLLSIRSAFS